MNNKLLPKQIGLNTELHCISYFSDCGFLVSTPYGDNGRYDIIVDVNGHLLRVQIKTASLNYNANGEADGIKFSCKSARINTKETYVRRYTKDEIDYFATYWNYQVYVIPVEETSSEKKIYFYDSLNNQNDNRNYLEDYTITNQWNKFLNNEASIEEPEKINYNIEKNSDYFCQRCGKPISKYKTHCPQCMGFLNRRVTRPTRDELKQMIRNMTFVAIGQKYGVSDKAISKWCKTYNLPSTKKEIKRYTDEEWTNI